MTTPRARMDRWRTAAFAIWAVIGGLILLYAAGSVLGRISAAIAPFIVAFVIVFTMQWPVSMLSKRGVGRGWGVLICYLTGIVAVGVAVVFIAPPVSRQLTEFAQALPQVMEALRNEIDRVQALLTDVVLPQFVRDAVVSLAESLSGIFVRLGNTRARALVTAGGGLATAVIDLALGAVIAFWTLKDLPKIREELRALAGEKYEDDLERLLSTIGRTVGGYLKGQTIASLATGAIAWIGLALIGVPYAGVVGIVTFVLNYVPYVGPFVAGLLAAALGLFTSPWTAVGAIAIVVGAQNVTDTLITPRVMSEQVDLHPTLVIFSLLVGGTVFGVWGMIFSIPVAGVLKALFVYYYEQYTSRRITTENGALFRTSTCADNETDENCDETAEDATVTLPREERDPRDRDLGTAVQQTTHRQEEHLR